MLIIVNGQQFTTMVNKDVNCLVTASELFVNQRSLTLVNYDSAKLMHYNYISSAN